MSVLFALTRVDFAVGEQNVFVSIVEGDSKDNTKALLGLFSKQLERRGIPHRIISEDTSTHWWPYKTAPERIGFLAKVRNRALEPISSDNSTIRLLDHDTYTKVIFLNDIYYTYQSIVRLLATRLDGDASLPPDYDLACATDFGWSGECRVGQDKSETDLPLLLLLLLLLQAYTITGSLVMSVGPHSAPFGHMSSTNRPSNVSSVSYRSKWLRVGMAPSSSLPVLTCGDHHQRTKAWRDEVGKWWTMVCPPRADRVHRRSG